MNLAVLISGSGSNLQAFIDACAGDEFNGQVAVVLSNKADAYGLQRARQSNIPTLCIDHRNFSSREEFDAAMVTALADFDIDLVILAGFMRILTSTFIETYRGRLLNIHPSLLPKYPGLHTHQRAIDAGDTAAGATVHFVTEELDGGPPIIQAQVPITAGDDCDALAARVLVQEHKIYPQAAAWFCEGRLTLEGNRALLDGEPIQL
jgi:phosphoribosylglycinamide formyltransferase-1